MSFIPNKVERQYIKRLFELKPNCTGQELYNFLEWCNRHDMKGVEAHYGHVRDDVILNAIKGGQP